MATEADLRVSDKQATGEAIPDTHSAEKRHQEPEPRFKAIKQLDVPKGRDGKHKQIVTQLLSDIRHLEPGQALKIPLAELPDSKENIRSALNRATRQRGMDVATSSDAAHLYVWLVEAAAGSEADRLKSGG